MEFIFSVLSFALFVFLLDRFANEKGDKILMVVLTTFLILMCITYYTLFPNQIEYIEPIKLENKSTGVVINAYYNHHDHIVPVPNNVTQIRIIHPRQGSLQEIRYELVVDK